MVTNQYSASVSAAMSPYPTVVIVIIAQYIATPYWAPSAMSLFPPKYRCTQPCSRLPSAPKYWLGMVPIAYQQQQSQWLAAKTIRMIFKILMDETSA